MTKTALIDNDFLQKVAEIKLDSTVVISIATRAFSAADINVMMHELVYANELSGLASKDPVKTMFDLHLVNQFLLNIIFADEVKKSYYEFCVKELYSKINGERFPFDDIRQWKRKVNLGEIHSLSACLICGFGIFLSDDDDSKTLRNIINTSGLGESIDVYNRAEFIDAFTEKSDLNSSEKHKFKHKK